MTEQKKKEAEDIQLPMKRSRSEVKEKKKETVQIRYGGKMTELKLDERINQLKSEMSVMHIWMMMMMLSPEMNSEMSASLMNSLLGSM